MSVVGVALVPGRPSESYCAVMRARVEWDLAHMERPDVVVRDERIAVTDGLPDELLASMRAESERARREYVRGHGGAPVARSVALDPEIVERCPDMAVKALVGGS